MVQCHQAPPFLVTCFYVFRSRRASSLHTLINRRQSLHVSAHISRSRYLLKRSQVSISFEFLARRNSEYKVQTIHLFIQDKGCSQKSTGRQCPRRPWSLKPPFPSYIRRGRTHFLPMPFWFVTKLLWYKAGVSGRKQFWNPGRRGRRRPPGADSSMNHTFPDISVRQSFKDEHQAK